MAVKIRLQRTGRKSRPYYRIAVMDARTRRGGATIEVLGLYDPLVRDVDESIRLDKERTEYWLGKGAQPSQTVVSFLRRKQVGDLSRLHRKARRRRPK